jgi:hypothetical protein
LSIPVDDQEPKIEDRFDRPMSMGLSDHAAQSFAFLAILAVLVVASPLFPYSVVPPIAISSSLRCDRGRIRWLPPYTLVGEGPDEVEVEMSGKSSKLYPGASPLSWRKGF